MRRRVWLTCGDVAPAGALASAPAHDACGAPACVLAVSADPRPGALAADPRAFDAGGPAAAVSLVLLDPGVHLPFDDPVVVHARRQVLRARAPRAVTTFALPGGVRFAGALTAVAVSDARRLDDDPFARIAPARRLLVGPGLLAAAAPAPAGPVVERYAGAAWPFDRFG